MSRRTQRTGHLFDVSRHISKLDEDATFKLVSDALRHLPTDEIISLVMAELDEWGKDKLLAELEAELQARLQAEFKPRR
jgi:hypothetical protein